MPPLHVERGSQNWFLLPVTTFSYFTITEWIQMDWLHLLHNLVCAIDRVVVLDPSAHPPLHVEAVVVWIDIPYL